jgi:hypothetical protein
VVQALRGSVGHLQAIDAVPVRPPYYSLLVAADVIEDGVTWQQGVEWNPEQVFQGGVTGPDCFGSVAEFPDPTNPVNNAAEPFAVSAVDECSTFGWQARDYEGRARRQLAAVRSAFIAHEFQVNSLALQNVALQDAQQHVMPDPALPVDALAEMEGAMAARFGGRRGMIHVTPQTFTLLKSAYAVEFVANKWQTGLGTIIVADAGYRSVSGQEFMYGTLMVQVRLGEVLIVPGSLEQARAQATNRATNLTTVVATQLALVQYDSTESTEGDNVLRVEVDLTPADTVTFS